MLYEKFICLLVFSLASIFIIHKKPTSTIIILVLSAYIGILLYKDNSKKPLQFKLCVLVSGIVIALFYYQNKIKDKSGYTKQYVEIYDENNLINYINSNSKDTIESFSNKLEKFKNKKYLSEKFRGKLNKKTKKENMKNISDTDFKISNFNKEIKEYFYSFNKAGLTKRSKNIGESYQKLLQFKEKFLENF